MINLQDAIKAFNTAWFYIRTPIKAGNYYCRARYLKDPSYNKTEINNAFKDYCAPFSPWHDIFTNSDNVRIANSVIRGVDVVTSFLPIKLLGFITNTATSVSVSKWEKDRDQHLLKIKQLDDSCMNSTTTKIVDLLKNEAGYSYSPFWIIGPEIAVGTVNALLSNNFLSTNFIYLVMFSLPRYMQLEAENKRFVESRSKVIAKIAEECTEGIDFLRENFKCDKSFEQVSEMIDEILLGNCQLVTTELAGEEQFKTEL